jgi:hypothetical protein
VNVDAVLPNLICEGFLCLWQMWLFVAGRRGETGGEKWGMVVDSGG